MKKEQKAFQKGLSSVFVIGTPFQLMCAVEAIHTFEVSDYKIIVAYYPSEIRNKQTFSMLNFYNLPYELINLEENRASRLFFNKECYFENSIPKFDRAFVGDFDKMPYKLVALQFLKRGGDMVYLDDGIATISALKDIPLQSNLSVRIQKNIFSLITRFRGISTKEYFFTVYSDIGCSKQIFPNKFEHLISLGHFPKVTEDVYFVGTNSELFARYSGLTALQYDLLIEKVLGEIKKKYPGFVVYYIPHGRDKNQKTEEVCSHLGIVYKRLDEAVELYLIKNNIYPQAVAGFTSSALFNIKKMMPKVHALNYFVDNKKAMYYVKNKETSEYYEKNEIILINVKMEDLAC